MGERVLHDNLMAVTDWIGWTKVTYFVNYLGVNYFLLDCTNATYAHYCPEGQRP